MAVRIACPQCEKQFDVTPAMAGRKAKCAGCGLVFLIPEVAEPETHAEPAAPETIWDDSLDQIDEEPLDSTPYDEGPAVSSSRGRGRDSSGDKLIFWGVGAVIFLFCAGIAYFVVTSIMSGLSGMGGDSQQATADAGPILTEPVTWPTEAEFPTPHLDHPIEATGRASHETVTLPVADGEPGYESAINVFMPPIKAEDGTLPCAFVPADKDNPFAGGRFGQVSGQDQVMRKLANGTGMILVVYDVDGGYLEKRRDAWPWQARGIMRQSVTDFLRSRGGMVNARNATTFALENIPAIDPNRLYSLSLMGAGETVILHGLSDDRIAGCIASGAVCDIVSFLKQRGIDREIGSDLAEQFAYISVTQRADEIRCPIRLRRIVFGDSALDAENEQVFGTRAGYQAYVAAAEAANKGHLVSIVEETPSPKSANDLKESIEWIDRTRNR